MHPRDFKENFEVSDDIIMVPKRDGSIVRERGINWPASLYESRGGENRLSELVRNIVLDAWGGGYESEETRVVGKVVGQNVERSVVIFARVQTDDIESTGL